MAGFSLVAADNPALGPALRSAARRAADEFVNSVENTPRDTAEGQYLRELLMAAVSFAAGLTRRQQERTQRIAAAEQERNFNFRRIAQTQKLGGMLKGGLQLLVLGGFAFAAVSALFSVAEIRGRTPGVDQKYASLATALASGLLGGFLKAWYTGWQLDRVDRKHKLDLRQAKHIYHREAVQEYEYAAQEANLAWQRYTGQPPPMTDAFRVLVLGLLAGEGEQVKSAAATTGARGDGEAGDQGSGSRVQGTGLSVQRRRDQAGASKIEEQSWDE